MGQPIASPPVELMPTSYPDSSWKPRKLLFRSRTLACRASRVHSRLLRLRHHARRADSQAEAVREWRTHRVHSRAADQIVGAEQVFACREDFPTPDEAAAQRGVQQHDAVHAEGVEVVFVL